MSFRKLYEHCQTLSPTISRRAIREIVRELVPNRPFRTIQTTLNLDVVRGYYLSARNTQHRIVQQLGANVIVVGRGNNYCWERFVEVKEMMHLFDDPLQSTGTGEQLESLIEAFVGTASVSGKGREPFNSDVDAMFMAVALFCPEAKRLEYIERRNRSEGEKGAMDDMAVATELRMPALWVQRVLFHPHYRSFIDGFLVEAREPKLNLR